VFSAENIIIDEHYARMNLNASVGAYILIVTDTGTGISPEILIKILSHFLQPKSKVKAQGLVFNNKHY